MKSTIWTKGKYDIMYKFEKKLINNNSDRVVRDINKIQLYIRDSSPDEEQRQSAQVEQSAPRE